MVAFWLHLLAKQKVEKAFLLIKVLERDQSKGDVDEPIDGTTHSLTTLLPSPFSTTVYVPGASSGMATLC